MRIEPNITQESFDALLDWLDPDRGFAGQKYEIIRAGLVKMFVAKGFSDAEQLADVTIDRVVCRLPDIRTDYLGEPACYFYGVARNIVHEARRRKEIAMDVPQFSVDEIIDVSEEMECLRKCLKRLPGQQRKLMLEYYGGDERARIERRKKLALERELTTVTLRVRAHRIRAALQECVLRCLKAS